MNNQMNQTPNQASSLLREVACRYTRAQRAIEAMVARGLEAMVARSLELLLKALLEDAAANCCLPPPEKKATRTCS